jgi:hypothetical protein
LRLEHANVGGSSLNGPNGGPNDTRIIAELSGKEPDVAVELGPHMRAQRLAYRVAINAFSQAETAANYNRFRIEDIDELGNRRTERGAGGRDNFAS